MTKEFTLHVAQAFMIISAIVTLISPLLFREGGLILGITTRKGIIATAVSFWIFLLSGGAAAWIYDSSQFLGPLVCVGGLAIMSGIYFVISYLCYPRNKQKNLWLQRERQKLLRLKHERQENLHKDKDGVE